MQDEADFEELIGAMTVEEKVAMAAGSGLWYSTPVPRLGIPSFKMSDGPNGVRGDSRTAGITSTCFPVGIALGASWDPDLLREVGAALAQEARAKDVDVLLGPTINLHRSPLAGRNFECYAEDPHLTAELALAYTRGVQGGGVAVCLKHFVCNDSEFERHGISSEVDERTLREVYLQPFERAIREAGAWTVMSAYNRLNGRYCSAHPWLLGESLKGRWAFDGVVISDWNGTCDTLGPAQAGLDLEMPGPAVHMGEKLQQAVDRGEVDEHQLDDKVRRQLRLMARTGRLAAPEHRPETAGDDPAHRALARRAAAAGMVLLKNEGPLLPLESPRRIALIGPNALGPQIQGGGSGGVTPHEITSPAAGLADAFPDAELVTAPGCRAHRYLPTLDPARWRVDADADRAGLRVDFHAGFAFEGEPVVTTRPRRSDLMFFGNFNDALPRDFSARIRGWFTPEVSGTHRFSLMSAGLARLFIDGTEVVDNWDGWTPGEAYFDNGSRERIGAIELEAGRPVQMEIRYSREGALGQAFGAALADVLGGAAEPGGRLPLTLSVHYEDHPVLPNYPGADGRVHYAEGTLIGHRGFQAHRIPVAFPFGHGLGYTRFEIDDVAAEPQEDGVRVTARLVFFDTTRDAFALEPGTHRFDVGLSVDDVRGSAEAVPGRRAGAGAGA